MPDEIDATWESFGKKMTELRSALSRCRSVNVNTARLKTNVKDLVQLYFRQIRPTLPPLGFSEEKLGPLDTEMQELLRLSNGNNRKSYYLDRVKRVDVERRSLETQREILLSQKATILPQKVSRTAIEHEILKTLQQIAPTAALSYDQASRDIADTGRVSFRGTANELREALRELLDHLAPDAEVESQTGFKHEKGQTKPTMKQKVRFILRARGLPTTAIQAPEGAVVLIDEMIGKLTRSTYNRSSISAHVPTARSEVRQMKMYVDSVLAELLEVHRGQ
jgi:DNA-binding XRE family transcriptional regulator